MYYIYWIKRKSYTDPESEGYIGFSDNPERRLLEHKNSKNKKSRVFNYINKYGDIILEVLYSFENKYDALRKEKELRPKKYIGWNIAIGGNSPPPIKDDIETKQKISNTIKRKMKSGEIKMPDISKLHSIEAMEKRKTGLQKKQKRFFYDPITLRCRGFDIGLNEIPLDHWLPGRKPRSLKTPLKHNEVKHNVWNWKVFKNGQLFWTGENLKDWGARNSVPITHQDSKIRVLKETKKYYITKSENRTIVVNGVDTNLNAKSYSVSINKSESWVSSVSKIGFYEEYMYDEYTAKKLEQA